MTTQSEQPTNPITQGDGSGVTGLNPNPSTITGGANQPPQPTSPTPQQHQVATGGQQGSTSATKPPSESTPQELEKTGNPLIDASLQALATLSKCGNDDIERALRFAIETGDVNNIDSAFIKERFKDHAELAEQTLRNAFTMQVTAQQSIVNAVYEKAGGADKWNQANELFKGRAPASLQAAAKALAEVGDASSINQAAELVMSFVNDNGLVPTHNGQLRGNTTGGAGALSSAEFRTEYAKLVKEAGNRSLESRDIYPQYQALLERRSAGKKAGLE